MARVNKSQFAILGCLSIKPMSAYEIKQFLRRSASHFWSEAEAQLYPTLKQLAVKDLVSYHEEKAEKAGMKKIFALTEAGEEALKAWLKKKAEQPVFRNELLLKLFFGPMQNPADNIKLIQLEMHDLEATLHLLQEIKDHMIPKKKISQVRAAYMEIVLDYGLRLIQTEIAWCKDSMKRLQQLA